MRFRIVVSAAFVVAVGLIMTSAFLVSVVRRDLVRSVETALVREADEIETLLDDEAAVVIMLAARTEDNFLAQLQRGDERIASTANLEDLPPLDTSALQSGVGDLDLPIDDAPFRVMVREVDGYTITVARSLDEGDSIAVLTSALVIAVPLLTLALAAFVWFLVGRTLRPVEEIRAEVSALQGTGDLHRRMPVPSTRDEIARLATTMNEMLERVEGSGAQQRAFVGDASHELRIPLTRIRTQLEVEMKDGLDPAAAAALHKEVLGLQDLVEDLLYLAQHDAQRDIGRRTRLDLDEIVRTEAVSFSNDQVHIALNLEPVIVVGDEKQLGRVFRNLTDNAQRHARSRVEISLRADNGAAVVTVEDDGPGIPAYQRERVFERFARLDHARSSDSGGTGLGLAIVKSIAQSHGGSVHVEEADRGARFVVSIPATE